VSGQTQLADAAESPLPSESCHVWFTDPPYYFAVPYADLSDFFFVWLKRTLPGHPLLRDPYAPNNPLTPKERELCEMAHWDPDRYHNKDKSFFENGMSKAFSEGSRVLKKDGIGCVVFAHKTTEGWEALLSGMIQGGWVITASWPIATERTGRLRARESAALSTSVHLVCRPRPEDALIGDWSEVLRELPKRVGDWMERLQSEGVRGADLVFACIGPALEIYSRYSKVEDAEGRVIPLGGDPETLDPYQRGYLAYVWETVGRCALEQILGTAEARVRNGAAGALEEDARLTALFLWTLQSTNGQNGNGKNGSDDEETEDDAGEEDDEEAAPRGKVGGFSLVFDVVRRFAQPLGIGLPIWEGRIIETKKGVVRLLSVSERAKQLFGEDGAVLTAQRIEEQIKQDSQGRFDFMIQTEMAGAPKIKGRARKGQGGKAVSDESLQTHREATTLDRVHAAMLLQANGRANALRAMIKAEQDRSPDFLRLANALSALYPAGSEEKRLLDAMLLAIPR
jgi:putative DNA methylase